MFVRIFACAWALLCALTATAGPLPVPTVEYAADRVIESEAGTFTGRVRSALGKERSEIEMQGTKAVMILRTDKQLGWMLMPAQKMYQELDLAKARKQSGGTPYDDVQIDVVGSEEIEGHAATKYRVKLKDGGAGGFMWFTADGIPVKMDLLTKDRGKTSRMTVTLTNLQVGAQDPAEFELPDGYTKMPSFGAAFGGGRTAAPGSGDAAAPGVSRAVFGGAKKLLGIGR